MSTAANSFILPVELAKSYRLLNHGPTVLVSASHAGESNVMAAAWACALDYTPAKLTVVIDKATKTRQLVEQSGMFVVQVPTRAQAAMVHHVGTHSALNDPQKLQQAGVEWFEQPGSDLPLVAGCSAWMVCKLVSESHNQQVYDLFIGEVIAAFADSRVFRDGHWIFEDAPDDLRSLHYIAGGHFYAIGDAVVVGPDAAKAQ